MALLSFFHGQAMAGIFANDPEEITVLHQNCKPITSGDGAPGAEENMAEETISRQVHRIIHEMDEQ